MDNNNEVVVAAAPANGLGNIVIDAKISMDDIVNVYVSQHEEVLHARRQELQADIKKQNAAKAEIENTIKATATATAKGMFITLEGSSHCVSYKVADAVLSKDGDKPKLTVSIKQTVAMLNDGATLLKQSSYSDPAVNDFAIGLEVAEDQLAAIKAIDATLVELKDKLVINNGEIQAIDRKTRQIKGLLAQKKMQDAGMTDILALPEIQSILALPAA